LHGCWWQHHFLVSNNFQTPFCFPLHNPHPQEPAAGSVVLSTHVQFLQLDLGLGFGRILLLRVFCLMGFGRILLLCVFSLMGFGIFYYSLLSFDGAWRIRWQS
jgi:hypothetical protein